MTPEEVKQARQQLGLNQTQFAAALGLSRYATVSDWENGRQQISETAALLIAAYLDGYRPAVWPV